MAGITVLELFISLVVGGLLGYVIAAHNSKANKEQVAALEAKVSGVEDKVKDVVEKATASTETASTDSQQTP